jgi:acetoin utilization deacetylase AcuC-like enzyme
MIGEGASAGYNINVPWENGRCGDADYFAVWDHILLPVAKEFNPDIIIVSAGFDAGEWLHNLEFFFFLWVALSLSIDMIILLIS